MSAFNTKPQIVVCGSIAIDRLMGFKGLYRELISPEKLDVLSLSMLLNKVEVANGGIGANIVHSLAMLGENPILVTSIGQDGQDYANYLASVGVNTSYFYKSDLPTATFNCISDSEGNQISGFYEGAMTDSDEISFKKFKGQNILAMIAGNNPKAMNRQIQECNNYDLPMVFDPGQQTFAPDTDLAAGLETAQLVFVNDYELNAICKKINTTAEAIKKQVPIIVTTHGKKGSIIEGTSLSEPIEIGRANVQLADPTGAGDGYRAGFLYGYVRNWDLKTCGQLGATVASFIVEKTSTQQNFTKDDVRERYQTSFGGEVDL